jgi:microcystin-dependent protein
MGGTPKNSSDTATQAHKGGKHAHHRNKHPGRPCPNPPAAPTGLAFTFKVREKKTHLEYSGKIKWNGVFEDEQGHKIPGGGVEIDHYEGVYWPTDNAGVPYEQEDGDVRVRRFHKKSVKGIKVTDAKMISGSIAEFTTKKAHGLVIGEIVRVQDCKPTQYNGRLTVLSAGLTATKFRADIGVAAPKDLEDEGTVEGEPDPNYNIVVEHIPNPKKWWWKAKVRAWDNKNCPSDWAEVGPFKPTQEARPQPPAPGFVSLTFDRQGGKKHNAFRGKVKISPVGFWDIPGFDNEDDVARYRVKVQVSADGLTNWSKHAMLHVRDSDDEKDEDANILLIFHNVRRRNFYRVWLASEDRFHRAGDYAGPYPSSVGIGVGGTPDSVNNVTVTAPTPRRLVAKWDEPNQPEDIDYYKIEWWRRNPLTLMDTNRSRNRNDVYRVPEADKGKAHFPKVYAVDEDNNESTPAQPADQSETGEYPSVAGNPPNTPSNPSFVTDGRGSRHAKYRVIVTAGTSTVDASHDAAHAYIIQIAHDATDTGANPPAGSKRQHGRVEGDATGDDLQEVFRSIPKRHYLWVRERARNSAGASAWTGWRTASRSIDFGVAVAPNPPTGVTVTTPAPRRVKVTWNDPDDDETIRWRVEIRRGGVTVETGFTRSTRYIYHVPKAAVNQTHNARVFAISDTGTDSSQVDSLDGTPGDDVGGVLVGSIRWHAGASVPTSYLQCDGSIYNPTTYPVLYGSIGTTYGGTAGSPLLPDIKNRKVKGKGNLGALGANEGLAEGSRDDTHNHGNHKHGNHNHTNHQHNVHGHNNHGHVGHAHDDHINRGANDGLHGHSSTTQGPNSQTTVAGSGGQAVATAFHGHNFGTGGGEGQHSHDSQGNGNYIQGRGAPYNGYHGWSGPDPVGAVDDQNGSSELFGDGQGNTGETTNDGKRSPHIVLWAVIKTDDI